MIQKKVCLLGTSGVGKTSLVAQFVHSMFSEKYLTTVGVKIDKKTVKVDGTEVTLVIWDLAGDDDFQRLQTSYLRGTSGYLLVADGTPRVTLDQVLELQKRVAETLGGAPFLLALNKADLTAQWEVEEARLASLVAQNFSVLKTSAKEGAGVEEAFAELARRMIQPA
ncbi:MAG: GTP-binding protein [Chthoniobacterales bacterium]|nr:GTP-binding protein [Chthoniobacterales bacterium]